MGGLRGVWASVALAAVVLTASALFAGTVTYTYDARGRVTSATYANGLTTAYVYDAAGNRMQVATAAPPTANPVSLIVTANSGATSVPLSVAGSYTSVSIGTAAGHGSAVVSGATITYTPTSGYAGTDSFTYKATNASGTSAAATVLVAVAPLASAVGLTVAYDSSANPVPLSITGGYTVAALYTFPSHGSATPSGTLINYTPAAGYSGSDSFQYVASNAVATSPAANVSITVNAQTPVANPVTASVGNDTTNNPIPLNITGGTPTSVAVASGPSHGSATASGITISYSPNHGYAGADSFTYTASNTGGTSSAATASVTVTPPTAVASASFNCPTGAPTYVCTTGTTSSYTFTGYVATVTVTNGSGSYTYAWATSGVSGGTWTTGQTTSTVTPAVSGVLAQTSGTANYSCTVTDTVTGLHATSNVVPYTYFNGHS